MELQEGIKRKHIEAAVKFLSADGSHPLDYALGGGGGVSPRAVTLIVFSFLILVPTSAVLLSSLVVDGVLLSLMFPVAGFAIVQGKPRGVLLTDKGVAVLRRARSMSRPGALLDVDSPAALGRTVGHQLGYTRIQVGASPVWLRDADLTRFQQRIGN